MLDIMDNAEGFEDWLETNNFYYEKEVSICFFKKIVRADFVIYTKNKEKIVIEYKNSLNDLNSGFGLNFVGDFNFIACNHNLYMGVLAKIQKLRREDVGIIVYEDSSFRTIRPSVRTRFDDMNYLSCGAGICLIDKNEINILESDDNYYQINKNYLYDYYKINFNLSFEGHPNPCKYYILGDKPDDLNFCISAGQILGTNKKLILLDFSGKTFSLPNNPMFEYQKISEDDDLDLLHNYLKEKHFEYVLIYSDSFNQEIFNFCNFVIFVTSDSTKYSKFNSKFNIKAKLKNINHLPNIKSEWIDDYALQNTYKRIFEK